MRISRENRNRGIKNTAQVPKNKSIKHPPNKCNPINKFPVFVSPDLSNECVMEIPKIT